MNKENEDKKIYKEIKKRIDDLASINSPIPPKPKTYTTQKVYGYMADDFFKDDAPVSEDVGGPIHFEDLESIQNKEIKKIIHGLIDVPNVAGNVRHTDHIQDEQPKEKYSEITEVNSFSFKEDIPEWYIELCEKCEKSPNKKHILIINLDNLNLTRRSIAYSIGLERRVNVNCKLPENVNVYFGSNGNLTSADEIQKQKINFADAYSYNDLNQGKRPRH